VLTDERFFRGHDRYLSQIREAVDVPLLRKEFIIDGWQIAESRALGADAILLIVAILTTEQIRVYQSLAHALGMAALVETHTEEELQVALELACPLIGINNRNLHTFETTLATTERLAALAPPDGKRLLVSESGIYTAADVERVSRCGAEAILVGEALVREGNVSAKVRELSDIASPQARLNT
jgi:indole-3-glycerol phosphate synthase